MNRAFSNTVIHSSNAEEKYSSEEGDDIVDLSGNELKKCLKDIPSYDIAEKKNNDDKMESENSTSTDSSTTISEKISKQKKLNIKNKTVKTIAFSRTKNDALVVQESDTNDYDSVQSENSTSTDSSTTISGTISKQKKPNNKKKTVKNTDFTRTKNDTLVVLESDINNDNDVWIPQTSEITKRRKKNMIVSSKQNHKKYKASPVGKYCPTCGRADNDNQLSKYDLDNMKRSIEYRIQEEAKITRSLIATAKSTTAIETIMKEDIMIDLPKTTLEDFLYFDKQLKVDIELMKKMKCFMVLHVNSTTKLSQSLRVIPLIISKEIQLQYSAFGRETNGIKKLNFSGTTTYKYLRDVLTSKYPDIKEKEISSDLSRWFSGAKDREGGKRERIHLKIEF
ncbi:uncharacterized protein LOC107883630 [Acyrthosiphon pisum]|uniref:Uncharacterized protein n=1 Tax=Acyrthosiphon pisum TaxID=7029 RepID=A0A8R2NJK0_ACYPI|nr:uncharacterized protein LOC107883630 [Acyrthosiphon pisum]